MIIFRHLSHPGGLLLLLMMVLLQAGCAVPQPRGDGLAQREVEPVTGSGYWLYLPQSYVENNGQRADGQRWPLVVSFHGMKPWDNAGPQCREWQEEADRYGFIILAPELRTCDSFMQFPLRDRNLSYVRHDEDAVLNMMDEVFRRTNADPKRVLSTSWSSGGYMAHFMLNQYPERFTVLAVRQSNFSEHLLDPRIVPRYRNAPIGIFFGENDLPVCRKESLKAVRWYRQHGFARLSAKLVSGLGHERTPQTAAAFFAQAIGARPASLPELSLVMRDITESELEQVKLADTKPQPREPQKRRNDAQPGPPAPTAPNGNYGPTSSLPEPRRPALRPLSSNAPLDTTGAQPVSRPPLRQPYGDIPPPAPRTPQRAEQMSSPKSECFAPPSIGFR